MAAGLAVAFLATTCLVAAFFATFFAAGLGAAAAFLRLFTAYTAAPTAASAAAVTAAPTGCFLTVLTAALPPFLMAARPAPAPTRALALPARSEFFQAFLAISLPSLNVASAVETILLDLLMMDSGWMDAGVERCCQDRLTPKT